MIIPVLVGIIVAVVVFVILNFATSKVVPRDDFQRSQEKVLKGLQSKKDAFDKEISQEQLLKREQLRQEMERLNQNLRNKEDDYKEKVQQLQEDYEGRRRELKELDEQAEQERAATNLKKIKDEETAQHIKITQLDAQYKEKTKQLDEDFFQYSEQVLKRKNELAKEIQEYEDKQKEIIARFKLDEERKQQADFYRIKISDLEHQDVIKLKTLSTSFSKPEVLLKLLYEVYYKTKMEEMFKRVLGENKDKGGIYKITNINNNKVYIGKTTNFLTRWRTHAKRGCGIERIKGQLYDAMFEDGIENYMWEIVEVCPKEEQTVKEKYWTEFYKSNEYGYNMRQG